MSIFTIQLLISFCRGALYLLQALGKLGKVVKVFPTGELKVKIGSHSWTYNPACCVPEPGSALYGSSESDSDSDSDDSSDVLKSSYSYLNLIHMDGWMVGSICGRVDG